jgi:hypothetical protein
MFASRVFPFYQAGQTICYKRCEVNVALSSGPLSIWRLNLSDIQAQRRTEGIIKVKGVYENCR